MGEVESGDFKTPLKQKITLLRFYNLPLGIQPLKGLLKESIQLIIIELYVKKESDLLFIQNFSSNLQKRGKEDDGKEQKNKAKEG